MWSVLILHFQKKSVLGQIIWIQAKRKNSKAKDLSYPEKWRGSSSVGSTLGDKEKG